MAGTPSGKSSIDTPGWPARFGCDDLIDFTNPVDEVTAAWWSNRFTINGETHFPREVAERLISGLPGIPRCLYRVISPETDRVSLEMHGSAQDATQLWFLGQTLGFFPSREMFNDLTEVAEPLQGGGIGKIMMSNCFELASELQMTRLRLKAAWVGAYSWLRFGFVPDRIDWEGDLKSHITGRLLSLKPFIPSERFNRMLRILSSDEPMAAWLIADDATQVRGARPDDESSALGQALLADCGASWYGTLAFDDDIAVRRFERYVGRQA